ncbi:hypothetical protein H0W80_00825 [Candidatus Saccharibacteria bacterium]|nr:hypothetical protein [Candidatus Saccharibacteria bacterium]
MITLGYVESPEATQITKLTTEDPQRGFKAFVVYNSNHYHKIVFVSETRVVLQSNDDSTKYVAFDGPVDEMQSILARAREKVEKRPS